MKKKTVLIIIGSLLIIGIIITSAFFITKKEAKAKECIKKGNLCDIKDIANGIKVKVDVSDNKSYDFYMVSNSKDKMTLIMSENIIKEENWHSEFINFKGPIEAIGALADKTSSWTKVPLLSNYEYKDYGKSYFEKICSEEELKDDYDCTTDKIDSRGYDSFVINDKEVYLDLNIPKFEDETEEPMQTFILSKNGIRARLITIEELQAILIENKNPKWLISDLKDNEGYWTLSSSTSGNTFYNMGAYSVVNIGDNKLSVESVYVMKDYIEDYMIGIRPVIIIDKQ